MIRYCTGPCRRPSEKEAVVPFSQLTTSIRRASVTGWSVGRSINDQSAACDLRRCVFIAHGVACLLQPSGSPAGSPVVLGCCGIVAADKAAPHMCVDRGFVCAGMAFWPDLFAGLS